MPRPAFADALVPTVESGRADHPGVVIDVGVVAVDATLIAVASAGCGAASSAGAPARRAMSIANATMAIV